MATQLLICCSLHVDTTDEDKRLLFQFPVIDQLQTIAELKVELFETLQREVAKAVPGAKLRQQFLTELKKDSVACFDKKNINFYLVPGDAEIFTVSMKAWIPPPGYVRTTPQAALTGASKSIGVVVPFADVSDSGALEVRKWASTAPDWRKASPGLCVEGTCTNTACKASGKMVIMNKGMCHFDLVEESDSCVCPECEGYVVPRTCAFNRCQWKFSGTKVNPAGGPSLQCSAPWKTAGDQYERFKDGNENQASWKRLMIVTQDTRKAPKVQEPSAPPLPVSDCSICLDGLLRVQGTVGTGVTVTSCGHSFHSECLAAWAKMPKDTCPNCRANVSTLTQTLRCA